jgi:hypothetical protein
VNAARKKSPTKKAASPIPEVVVVVPPRSKAIVPASKPTTGKTATKKRAIATKEVARGKAGKTSRAEIRVEAVRHVPSRLTPQQAKRKGAAPGSRAAKAPSAAKAPRARK